MQNIKDVPRIEMEEEKNSPIKSCHLPEMEGQQNLCTYSCHLIEIEEEKNSPTKSCHLIEMEEQQNSPINHFNCVKDTVKKIFGKRCLVIVIPILILLGYVKIVRQYRSDEHVIQLKSISYDASFVKKQVARYKNNWRNLSEEEIRSLSVLGRILYLNETPPAVDERREKYKILMWKYGPLLEEHLIYHFGATKHDPFEDCSATNCVLTYEDEDLSTADIVLVHMHSVSGVEDLPPMENRSESQIWVFDTRESPHHTLSQDTIGEYNGFFNWTMSYRMDAEIPIPYGRTILESSPKEFVLEREFNEWIETKSRDVLVAIMGSNCEPKNSRWLYVKELKNHMEVDAYGDCGTLKCPGHIDSDCAELNKYMFYLAFENSNCKDYLTEKLWWNAYHKNSIPIIMGPPNSNLEKLLPYHSYISVDDFASPKDLAHFLIHLSNTPTDLATYIAWKSSYRIVNEHGYFKSNSYFYYCRACEALNYNSREHKVYNDLQKYWSLNDCYPSWDKKT